MAETARSAHGLRKSICDRPGHPADTMDDHLRNPVPPADHERFLTVVDQDDPDFTAVIRIDRPGRIEQRHPIAQSQSAPGADLGLVALG